MKNKRHEVSVQKEKKGEDIRHSEKEVGIIYWQAATSWNSNNRSVNELNRIKHNDNDISSWINPEATRKVSNFHPLSL